ncbi:MAG: GDCCVxC domain-containing (seleno)protein [Ramlibacter sp.]
MRSVLTCPQCGHAEAIEMPLDHCLFFHECTGCGEILRPRSGDCCVFCSYGSMKCPPKQTEGGTCSAERSPGL